MVLSNSRIAFMLRIISGAEVALFSLSQTEVDETTQGNLQRKIISELLKDQKLLATLLVANNFINIELWHSYSLFIGGNLFSFYNFTGFEFTFSSSCDLVF
jgi:Mg2+/Co2+ transporter CorB